MDEEQRIPGDELILPDEPIGQSWEELLRQGYRAPEFDEYPEEFELSKTERLRRRLR